MQDPMSSAHQNFVKCGCVGNMGSLVLILTELECALLTKTVPASICWSHFRQWQHLLSRSFQSSLSCSYLSGNSFNVTLNFHDDSNHQPKTPSTSVIPVVWYIVKISVLQPKHSCKSFRIAIGSISSRLSWKCWTGYYQKEQIVLQ